jgi:hypothetical protein
VEPQYQGQTVWVTQFFSDATNNFPASPYHSAAQGWWLTQDLHGITPTVNLSAPAIVKPTTTRQSPSGEISPIVRAGERG